MKKIFFAIATLCIIATATSCQKKGTIVIDTDATPALNNKNDSLSWAMGFSLAQSIAATGVDINRELLMQAISVTLDSKKQPLTQEQTMRLITEVEQSAFLNKTNVEKKNMEETRQREGDYFAKLTKENSDVKKSDKGFYYQIVKEGSGRQCEQGLVAVFDYKGYFTNGQLFDQTYGNRPPITHAVAEGMMPGLLEGLCMMKAGSTYRFYFPAEMAFGASGTEGIPPYSTVIYEVELHEVRDL